MFSMKSPTNSPNSIEATNSEISLNFNQKFRFHIQLFSVMSVNVISDQVETQDEAVPQIITEEFFKTVQVKTESVIKDLREQEQYETAREFMRLLAVAENLQQNFCDEQMKVQELTEKHVEASGRIEEATRISKKDQDVIGKLREEVIEAWKITDASKNREIELAEKLSEIRKKFEKAEEELKTTSQRFEETDSLGKHKKTILLEYERVTEEVRELNKRLQVHRAYSDEIQKKLDESIENNRDLYRQWDAASNEGWANKKKVESLQIQVEEKEEQLDNMTETMMHFKNQAETRHARLKDRDKQLTEKTEELTKARKEIKDLTIAKTDLDTNLKDCSKVSAEMKLQIIQLNRFMSLKEDESRKLAIENERGIKKIEALIRKVAAAEQVSSRFQLNIQHLQTEIMTAQKERESIIRTSEVMKRDNDNLHKKISTQMREIEKREGSLLSLARAALFQALTRIPTQLKPRKFPTDQTIFKADTF